MKTFSAITMLIFLPNVACAGPRNDDGDTKYIGSVAYQVASEPARSLEDVIFDSIMNWDLAQPRPRFSIDKALKFSSDVQRVHSDFTRQVMWGKLAEEFLKTSIMTLGYEILKESTDQMWTNYDNYRRQVQKEYATDPKNRDSILAKAYDGDISNGEWDWVGPHHSDNVARPLDE